MRLASPPSEVDAAVVGCTKIFYAQRLGVGLMKKQFTRLQPPVCFLNAVEKWEIEEYPSIMETSVTLNPFSYKRYLACSILWLW